MNSVEQVNITSEPNKIKVNYEIKENDYICGPDEKNEVDNILNNECFFSDSNQETKWYDDIDDNLMSQHIDYFENYNLKQLHHISNYYNIPKNNEEYLVETYGKDWKIPKIFNYYQGLNNGDYKNLLN